MIDCNVGDGERLYFTGYFDQVKLITLAGIRVSCSGQGIRLKFDVFLYLFPQGPHERD